MSAPDPGFIQTVLSKLNTPWAVAGLLGQAMFGLRFLVQWLASERAGRSIIPMPFWIFSLFGSWLLLAYAIYLKDPVFILANTFNTLIYVRNLMLIFKERKAVA